MTDIRRTATALTLGAAVVTGLGAPAAVAQTTAPATETATTARCERSTRLGASRRRRCSASGSE